LRCVFHTPHRLKDPTITSNYCAAKDQHYMGRGGLLAIVPSLGIPLFLQVTAKYKQSEESIREFLKSMFHQYGGLLREIEVYADSEFGTEGIKDALKHFFKATPYIDVYARSATRSTLTIEQKNIRKTVERVIARLETNFSLEHPSVLGDDSIAIHTQLCYLCDLLLVSHNLLTGNHSHPHSLSYIRG
ncbi:MAG: transposase, partial [Candidatus Hodarchaeales archaeon]